MDGDLIDNGNRVWDTLQQAVGAVRDYKVAALQRTGPTVTTAAPSGAVGWQSYNPFPNLFSAFPQADAKAGAQPQVLGAGINPLWLILGAVVLVLLVFARK